MTALASPCSQSRCPKLQLPGARYVAYMLSKFYIAKNCSFPLVFNGLMRAPFPLWLCLCVFFCAADLAQAQDAVVSDNAVNAVAEKMYCPVCENIPLDECHTLACIEWKEEIRRQLAQGVDEQAVISSFVRRFGDQVVGIPQDPVLRWLTVLTPLAALILAIALGARAISRFGAQRRMHGADDISAPVADDLYRQRLEEDLANRR